MRLPRSAGILLHITSLPGGFGVGDLGEAAFQFVEFLQQAGQTIWQCLPLGPPARGESPYSCYSAFAGNSLLISPAELVRMELLDKADLDGFPSSGVAEEHADFARARAFKEPLLKKALARFRTKPDSDLYDEFRDFCDRSDRWLREFARYDALMRHFDERDWTRWEPDLVSRRPKSLSAWDERLADQIELAKFQQFIFHLQWQNLKQYANDRGIRMFGDMPIFVAHESADVWAAQQLFQLDERGRPTVVAGVPPDYFCETGQLWGNPLYCWSEMAKNDFAWWTWRLSAAMKQFDLLRIDHFRGFESYWEIPADAETAIDGCWRTGPGRAPFDAARRQLGPLPIVAEDLGLITAAVHDLRDALGFPGMRVMQFGFDNDDDSYHRPASFPEHSVVYTGTHDNDTVVGWYKKRMRQTPVSQALTKLVSASTDPVHWQLIRAVLESPGDTAIIPMQDVLGLDSEARLNIPGQADGNWIWRAPASYAADGLADRLRALVIASQRQTNT